MPREEDTEQVVGGNGGQALSFASLCQSCAAVPPHLTFAQPTASLAMSSDLESLFSQIERRYILKLPSAFREIWRLGWCSDKDSIYLPDLEWLPLEAIRDYEFEDYQMPGFVPFATTGSGDLWCWEHEQSGGAEPRVVACPHDCDEGSVYAADFTSALYRQLLDGLAIHAQQAADVSEQVGLVRRCLDRYRPLLQPEHVRTLDSFLSRSVQYADLPSIGPARRVVRWHFLIPSAELSIIMHDQFPEITFRWMRPAYP